MKKVPVIRQITETECGLCCCAMLLRYYGSKESIGDLRDYLDAGRDGLSMYQLKKLLVEKGIKSKIYEVDNVTKLSYIEKPFIAYWNNKHFIMVEKIVKNKYYIIDPGEGRKIIKKEEFIQNFTKFIIVTELTDKFMPVKKRTYNPWKSVLGNLKEKKLLIFKIILCLVVVYGITLLLPNIVQKIVDNTTIKKNAGFLVQFLVILFMCLFAFLASVIVQNLKVVSLNVFLGIKLEANTYKKLLNLPYKFFEMRSSGDLLFRIQSTSSIKETISGQLLGGIIDFGYIIVIIIYMLQKSVRLTICAFVLLMTNILVLALIQPKMLQAINGEISEQTKSQAAQIESLYSIVPIKMAAIEKVIYKNWRKIYQRVIKMFKKRTFISNLYTSLTEILLKFAPIFLLCIGVNEYFSRRMTMGEVIAFQSISTTFFGSAVSIVNMYPRFLIASQYLERISEIWSYDTLKQADNALVRDIKGNIEFRSVSFSYTKNSQLVCKNLSFYIKSGTKVAIVGTSGAGKSTLSKLLVGLYEPTEGNIFYDGIQMEKYNRKSLCSQMGIVPQEAMLFNKTIYENIVMENKDVSLDKVKEVCQIACIDDDISAMPMGYNTLVSEMGMNLSGGQRQRILIARALISNPKILVLDEATSSLDNINESHISKYLSNNGCTRIIIAHKLSSIVDSDMILVMKNGSIVEAGTHEELTRINGEYSKLYYADKKIHLEVS